MALWALLSQSFQTSQSSPIARWELIIWHLDHGIRADSALDAELIRACSLPGKRCCEFADIPALAAAWGCGLEAAGRRQRYARLSAVAQAHGALCVVTAHHLDDQAETVLMNLLRGCHGLVGMPTTRALGSDVTVARPLLSISRAALRQFAIAQAIPWREDPTNHDTRFRRNYLRQVVLPAFESGCPGFTEQLVAAVRTHEDPLRTWLRQRGLPVSRAIIRRLLAMKLHASTTLGHRCVVKVAHGWDDAPEFPQTISTVVITGPGTYDRDGQHVVITQLTAVEAIPRLRQPGQGLIACSAIHGQLHWRSVRPGERWQPLGCTGHQSLMASAAAATVPKALRAGLSVLADDAGPLWLACGIVAQRARVACGVAALKVHLFGVGSGSF